MNKGCDIGKGCDMVNKFTEVEIGRPHDRKNRQQWTKKLMEWKRRHDRKDLSRT